MSGILAALAGIKTAIATAVDEYFNRTTLLLNTSSTNGAQNNTFLDSSTNNFTITRNGNTTQGTFTPFSQTGWSNYFNGSSYLSTASNSAFGFSTNNFTIEGWIYFTSLSGTNVVFDSRVTSGSNGLALYTSGTTLNLSNPAGGTNPISTGSILSTNAWIHFAVVRSGTGTNQTVLYINGVSQATGTVSGNFSNTAAYIGNSTSNEYLNGYLSNFRVVNGSAVYASAFTPSTTPLTAITNTSLLTCQSNRFLDNSTNAFVLTANGTPSVQAFSPFAPTAAYDTAVVGGSGYFDGSGDYLSNASSNIVNFTTGQFTIDYWFYPTAGISSSYKQHIGNAASASGIAVGTSTSGYLNATSSVSAIATGDRAVIPYAWNHIVWTRDASNNIRAFLNGKLTAYAASITTSFTDTGCGIGGTPGGSYTIDGGYFSNMRVVKSLVSDYSTSSTTLGAQIFTPPTAPTTAVTNTSFLLDYTNSGIYDSTAKNVLETVGNAQVSTTQAKWGTTAIYLDGSGDYAKFQTTGSSNYNFTFGSGDFTIEMWVYPSNTSTVCVLVGQSDNATIGGGSFLIRINGNVDFYSGGTAYTCTGASPSANQWSHIAYVRNGTSLKTYLNGTQAGTATLPSSTTAMNVGSTNYPPILGAYSDGSGAFTGYIDDVRISKFARYTANFSVPTTAFALQ